MQLSTTGYHQSLVVILSNSNAATITNAQFHTHAHTHTTAAFTGAWRSSTDWLIALKYNGTSHKAGLNINDTREVTSSINYESNTHKKNHKQIKSYLL